MHAYNFLYISISSFATILAYTHLVHKIGHSYFAVICIDSQIAALDRQVFTMYNAQLILQFAVPESLAWRGGLFAQVAGY